MYTILCVYTYLCTLLHATFLYTMVFYIYRCIMQYGDTIVPLSEDHSFSTAREMMRLKAHEMAEVRESINICMCMYWLYMLVYFLFLICVYSISYVILDSYYYRCLFIYAYIVDPSAYRHRYGAGQEAVRHRHKLLR